MPVHEIRAYLEWFVRRVQDRIVLCKLRQILVKSANKSRHSFEYLDRDEIIVAHLVGGIDAFIKVPQGWPIYIAALNLISLKSSSQYFKRNLLERSLQSCGHGELVGYTVTTVYLWLYG
nr:centrosomal protein of 290 kDa-like isoform X2 [Ipomoea batatas]